MLNDNETEKNAPKTNASSLPKRKKEIQEVTNPIQKIDIKKKEELKPLPARKPLKRRNSAELSPEPVKELILEETIKLPFLTTENIIEQTVEPSSFLQSYAQNDIEESFHKTESEQPPIAEPIIEETVELPLFKESAKNIQQKVEEKNTIVVETKTVKKKNSLFKKIIEYTIFVIAIVMSVFGAYKIVIWQRENNIIKQEMSRIQNLVEERIVEPTLEEQLNQTNEPSEEIENPDENEYQFQPNETPNENYPQFQEPDIKIEEEDGLSFIDVDITRLQTINTDTNAYIKIDNLDVNYPVVQTKDNTYYLTHSFDKKYTSAGWVFGDYRNNWNNLNDNTIIYGHNRRNYAMFGSLKKMYNKEWYENKDNHLIYISTENKNMIFQIFSIYDIPTETYYLTNNFRSKHEYQKFLDTIKGRSALKFDITPTTNDKILTLSTCSGSKNKTVVHAKLIKMQNK